jgi:hypothetical protein
VRPPGFSSYHGYGNLLVERIHARILGHAGRIPRSYLHDFCDHDIQVLYHDNTAWESKFYCEPCLAASMPKIFDLSSSTITNPSRWEWIADFIVCCLSLMMKLIVYSYYEADISIFIGCATSAPDGSNPWGYNGVLASDYRLQNSLTSSKCFYFAPFLLLTFPAHLKRTKIVLWAIL